MLVLVTPRGSGYKNERTRYDWIYLPNQEPRHIYDIVYNTTTPVESCL
jgi:hypothetical protein